ncbi:putative Histidine kinase [uncultured Desulfobacterium sp.]|uniref:histidine kinase n=1 Tax=uncultured Desulfobacterium sp. TaxID=201089 RepID=A0A445MXG0_9BACT|nr:putative Histidine kinase [uncultured Desulfobacterium sp.]
MSIYFPKALQENFRTKIFFIFTFFFFVMSLSLISYFIHNQITTTNTALIEKGAFLAKILARNSRIGVFSENERLLVNAVEAAFEQEEVMEVSVFNHEGNLLKKQERSTAQSSRVSSIFNSDPVEIMSKQDFPYYREVNSQLEFWEPVISGSTVNSEEPILFGENQTNNQNRIIGLIRITLDKKPLNTKVQQVLIRSVSLGVLFLITGAFIVYLVAKGVTKPLKRLTASVKALETGDVVKKIPVKILDEIGRLALAFNHMSESLQTRTKALEESEKKYRSILQNIEEGYYECDPSGTFMFINDSMAKILDYPKDEVLGTNYRRYLTEQCVEKSGQIISIVASTGRPAKEFELELAKKGGAKGFVESSASAIKDSNGRTVGVRGIMRDITERKIADEEKERLISQLQQAQKLEVVGTLAGGVAHDLNNILAGIINYPELLLMDLPQDSPLKKPLVTIQKSGEKAAAIVQDLLTMARRGVTVNEVVNLNDMISEHLNSPEHIKLKLYHPQVRVETNLQPNLLNVLGSPVHLFKTIMNLISNAAEAMPDGGTIDIKTENQYVDHHVHGYDDIPEGEYVVLTVSDNGSGISAEDKERIFEPFYSKKKMGRSGTGLGMAVIWGTVKDHKGYINLQTVEGKGTTFELFFPVTCQERAGSDSKIMMEDYMGNGESVLVVDDVKEQREVARDILTKLGYSVTSVASGEEAVEYVRKNSADLILLDMIMDPGIDGLETYRRLIELRPGQKAIIASGYSESEQVREVQQLGAGAYVKKPYTFEKIGLAIWDALHSNQ